ncbi:alpha/beta hydrolase [Pseudodonghicola flavimaris]|uniref:Alpha/beta hydrolase n=1 Tax=Pseudodonghicola flavimaris TaxID=3050036 RepID=A0ABT7F5T2_9RHOB|nr:alpha/beta hydrolase [Pseudodonghicola flavimaris]MDK3019963.1 alpha/beta hydrolase [Pseudodonghicola flavimaris]
MRVPYSRLSRAELDRQLSPSLSAKDFMAVLTRHEAETAALDSAEELTRHTDIAYGPGSRQRYDVTTPVAGSGLPCLAFVHGGFWQEGSKAGSGFAAEACVAAGRAHVAIGYTLAPEASLAAILEEIATALRHLRTHAADYGIDPARIVLAGHSAGAHLAAAILAGLGGDDLPAALAGYVLISGVYDLAPVAASYVNEAVGLSPADVEALSPLLYLPAADRPVHLMIGADEPEAFRRQSDALAMLWGRELSRISMERFAGRDHFDILDELAVSDSETGRRIAQMMAG